MKMQILGMSTTSAPNQFIGGSCCISREYGDYLVGQTTVQDMLSLKLQYIIFHFLLSSQFLNHISLPYDHLEGRGI
jgi:hypothetical protein